MSSDPTCGIYCITCVPTGRRYVGQSVHILRRWRSHRSRLRASTHSNSIVQRSWDKYGENAFEFQILEVVEADQLDAREVFWMEKLNSLARDGGMNIMEEIENGGRRLSKEVISKIVESKSQTLTVGGLTKTYAEWSKITGLSPDTIYNRVRLGWKSQDIISLRSRSAKIYGFGHTKSSMIEACKQLGIKSDVVKARISRGWCHTKALLTVPRGSPVQG